MITKLSLLLLIANLHKGFNSPLRQLDLKHDTILVPTHHGTLTVHQPNVIITRQKKNQNLFSIPIQHILVPKLHVIPAQSNSHHSSIHTDVNHIITNDNRKIPIISQTISHRTTNITHPTPVIPILIPFGHNYIPVHDLSVIPLQKSQKLAHYRVMMDKKDDEEEEVNRFRTFYGGYGTGLFFGGHGAGHGFHVFG